LLKAVLISFILISRAFAQDEDLTFLESSINSDPTTSSESESSTTTTTRIKKSRWSVARPEAGIDKVQDKQQGRVLDLRSVIEEGFRRNPFEQIRDQRREQIELLKTDVFQKFWFPTIGLELNTSNHRVDRFHESSQDSPGMGAQKAPTGSVGIVFDEYTLFNWGRDYLQYLNEKQVLNRGNQQLSEAHRRLKFSLINQYFNLIRFKEILRIKQEQLRQTSFIHRLAREKLQLRKIKTQEYYQTRSEYLRSQTEYQQAQFEVGIEEEKIANLLGDEYQGNYRSFEQLKYVSINTSMEEALRSAQDSSQQYRDAKVAYDVASRTYEKTLKDNLPLPKLAFNLGAYRTGFDSEGQTWNYQTSDNSRNVELVASINMRWTLLGEGGFFNARENQQTYLSKRITEINFFNTRRELEVKVRTIYKTVRFQEQKVEIAQFQYKNAQNNYDSALDNYIGGRTTYADIKLAIDNLVNSSVNSENVKYDHLAKKLELADFMGLEDFPGENFESLATR
jgi:outer membrane protein TolC